MRSAFNVLCFRVDFHFISFGFICLRLFVLIFANDSSIEVHSDTVRLCEILSHRKLSTCESISPMLVPFSLTFVSNIYCVIDHLNGSGDYNVFYMVFEKRTEFPVCVFVYGFMDGG